jgi:hypothetical protein
MSKHNDIKFQFSLRYYFEKESIDTEIIILIENNNLPLNIICYGFTFNEYEDAHYLQSIDKKVIKITTTLSDDVHVSNTQIQCNRVLIKIIDAPLKMMFKNTFTPCIINGSMLSEYSSGIIKHEDVIQIRNIMSYLCVLSLPLPNLKVVSFYRSSFELLKPFTIPSSVEVVKFNVHHFTLDVNILPLSLKKLTITGSCIIVGCFPSSLKVLSLNQHDKIIEKGDFPESLLKLKLKNYFKNIDATSLPTQIKVIKIPAGLKFDGREGLNVKYYCSPDKSWG